MLASIHLAKATLQGKTAVPGHLRAGDEGGAQVDGAAKALVPQRVHAAPDSVARLQHRHLHAIPLQFWEWFECIFGLFCCLLRMRSTHE